MEVSLGEGKLKGKLALVTGAARGIGRYLKADIPDLRFAGHGRYFP